MSFDSPQFQKLSFSVEGIKFLYAFHTETSLCLEIQIGSSKAPKGWVDVHYPCRDHIKLRLKGALPEECLTAAKIKELVTVIRDRLGIGKDETYSAAFFKASSQVGMTQSTDRSGMTDQIETTRSFITPSH